MAVELKKGRALESLSMTPFIDIVFILLFFFLVAARFAQEDRELPVQLPTAKSAVPMTMEPQVLVVGIAEKGSLWSMANRCRSSKSSRVYGKRSPAIRSIKRSSFAATSVSLFSSWYP